MRTHGRISGIAALIAFAVWIAATTASAATWVDVAPAGYGRIEAHDHVINGKLYVFTGFGIGVNVIPQCEVYDPVADSWTTFTSMPTPVTHMGSAILDGKVWFVGGFLANEPKPPTTLVQIYNPATNTWTTGPALPTAVAGGGAALVGRKLHWVGGLLSDRQTNTGIHYVLDVDNLGAGWTTAASMPDPRDHFSTAVVNGLIYTLGGQVGHDVSNYDTKLAHVYNPATNSWTQLADLPKIRSHMEPGTFVDNGKIIMVGGKSGSSGVGASIADVTQYDPATDTYTSLDPLPVGLRAPCAKVINGRLYVTHGGVNGVASPQSAARYMAFGTSSPPPPESYTLTVNTVGSGSVAKNPNAASYASGTSVQLTATPASGWTFAGWSGAASGTTNPINVSMTANKSVTATFTQQTGGGGGGGASALYRINTGGPAVTTGGVAWQTDQYFTGATSTFSNTAVADIAGTTDDALYRDHRSAGTNLGSLAYAIPVPNGTSYTVRLHFAEIFWGVPQGGTSSGGPGKRVFDVFIEGALKLDNYDIIADVGSATAVVKEFANVAVSDGILNIDFTTSANRAMVSAIEVLSGDEPPPPPTTYTLTVNTTGSGTVAKSPNAASYESGTVVQLTATPASGWTFTGWSGAISGTANPIDVTMNADKTVTATFTQQSSGTGQSVASFTLINANTDADIGPLVDGQTIDFTALGTDKLNVRANTNPATVGSVKFGLDENPSYVIESGAPYALAGDVAGDYNAWTPALGDHTLAATPFTESNGSGTAGTPLTVNFTVVTGGGGATNVWETVQATGTPAARHECGFVELGGKLHLIGGRNTRPTNIYDPATNAWASNAAPPFPLHHFQAVTLNGLIYVVGAYTGNYPSETNVGNVYTHNPATNVWTQGHAIPANRQRGSAGAVVRNGKIYVVGGVTGGHGDQATSLPWFDEYDPATGTWTTLPDAPRARDHYHAALVGDKLVVAGGRDTGVTNFFNATIGPVDIYDFATGQWTALTAASQQIPTQRAGCTAVAVGQEVIVIGGEGFGQAWAETEAFHVANRTWRSLDGLVDSRQATQAIYYDNALWIASGSGDQGGSPELTSMERLLLGTSSPPPATYTLSVNTVGSGTVAKSPDAASYASGTVVQLTATPASGWTFSGWSGAVSGTTNPINVTTNANTAVTATFTQQSGGDPSVLFRINAGGPAVTTGGGTAWETDGYFSGSSSVGANNTVADIAGTTDDALYRDYRSASGYLAKFTYALPVPNGTNYTVRLHFAELFWGVPGGTTAGGVGKRVFNVSIEGVLKLANYDITADVGVATAVVKEFTNVSVTDGSLTILFASTNKSSAVVSAIEVIGGPAVRVARSVPAKTSLAPNHPNPFNPTTTIPFALARDGRVRLAIYDALGQEVRVLVDTDRPAGYHLAVWDGMDGRGRLVGSGVYLARFSAEGVIETRRMVLLR